MWNFCLYRSAILRYTSPSQEPNTINWTKLSTSLLLSRPKYTYFNSLNAKLPSYRNQSNNLEDKSIDWFLYDNFEVRVKQFCAQLHYRYFFKTFSTVSNSLLQGTVDIPILLKIKHLGHFLISFRQAIFGTYRNRFNHKQK